MVDVGSASASSSGSNQNNSNPGEEDKKDERMFECNICLDTAKDAVVSMCGHLFCWPCLHQWLETRPARQMCPVCKAAISKEKVIPLYGRGSSKQEDPRNKAPPRPAGQRSEPEANTTEEGQWWVSEEESANESANESGSPDFVVDSEDSDAIFYRDWVLDNSHAGIEYLLDVLRADSDDTDDTSLPWAESTDVDFSVDNSTVDSDDADTMSEDDGVDVVSLDEWHTAIVGGLDIDSSDSVSEVSNASESSTDNVDTELSDSDL